MPRPKSKQPRSSTISVRLTEEERLQMESAASELGFSSVSEYLRHLHQQWIESREPLDNHEQVSKKHEAPKLFHETELGKIYLGDSLGLLHNLLEPNSVDLIFTSPPFGLVRKKSYGNEDADRYLEWFRPFAEGFNRVLKENGSLVIDIGGAWKKGTPTRSLYHFELLIMLCREFGLHLCQEHYVWNPSKLPTPAEWVNVRRVRIKDAINCVWWLSETPWAKANNRRVLSPYSDSMMKLLKDGYKAKLRPSGHDISTKFQKDNGGAVPPNLLAIPNTESNSKYQTFCKQKNLPVHPARFPAALPEYFIRFLTDEGDVVVDPFGGSCVTGEVCEYTKRQWICCEILEDYVKGAIGRFEDQSNQSYNRRTEPYIIYPPCLLPADESQTPLMTGVQRENAQAVGLQNENERRLVV
jgi:site-specific DNA-methyltransferase (cytosine-N4-specific)